MSAEDRIEKRQGKSHDLSRRAALKGASLVAGVGAASAIPSWSASQDLSNGGRPSAAQNDRAVAASADTAIVNVEAGRVAGYVSGDVFTFKGIPYGGTTEGPNRFSPPQKAKAWQGVRSCRSYGYVAPQAARTGWGNDEEAFMFQWDDGVQSEDCLRLNVWTPAINDGKKRPVMVWLHGGGFAAGSSHELPSYDGENLVRRGDVVVVSLNHRLNVLGYLDLSNYGARYSQSGNVGMLDIVCALEWVRDNISAFGGDPQTVTIFGQSGGGAKVNTLMAMPSAQGLFHRAIVESGSFTFTGPQDKSRRLADLVLAELGLTAATIDQIHRLPYADLLRASDVAMQRANPPPGGFLNLSKITNELNFGPVADGKVLPAIPFSPQAPAYSSGVPMIVGTTLNEFVTGTNHPEYELMTESELETNTEQLFPGRSRQIIAAFRASTPTAKPFDLWSRIACSQVREAAIKQASAKAAQNGAPAYLYWFTWQTPILDGRPRAFHCAELPFVFDNTDRCRTMTGGGAGARELAATVANAWIAFARTGDPNYAGMPRWDRFSQQTVPTMIFDNQTKMVLSPDGRELASVGYT